MWDLNEKYFGADRDKFQDEFVADIAFFNGLCSSCKSCMQNQKVECGGNFSAIVQQFRTPCEHLITNCAWNGRNFSCCDAFLPLETEFGLCYTINSVHTTPKYGLKLQSNRDMGPGTLDVFALEDVQIHLHSPNDVPYINTEHDLQETILWGLQKEIIFSTIEIFNDANIVEQGLFQRRCKFPFEFAEEDGLRLYSSYSYSTCVTSCVAEAQIAICNCTHHLMPPNLAPNQFEPLKICNVEGLQCLTENFEILTEIRRNCKCFISCEEPEYNIVYSSNE
uniref:Pickpocket n=1 Tax=Lutzomyia longipalpis TaxID=7200 RepID=A0A1B0CSV6_LUTLO